MPTTPTPTSTPADVHVEKRWYLQGGAVLSVLILSFILTFISLLTYRTSLHNLQSNNTTACLRPYSVAVDSAMDHVLVAALDRTTEAYTLATNEFRAAVIARDQAIKTC